MRLNDFPLGKIPLRDFEKIIEVQKQDKQFRILKDWAKLIFIITAISLLCFIKYARAETKCKNVLFTIAYYSNLEPGLGIYGASGKKLQNGDVACDRKFWKFGQKFLINGKIYACWDTGRKIKGKYRLDVFCKNCSVKKVKKLGIKKIKGVIK